MFEKMHPKKPRMTRVNFMTLLHSRASTSHTPAEWPPRATAAEKAIWQSITKDGAGMYSIATLLMTWGQQGSHKTQGRGNRVVA